MLSRDPRVRAVIEKAMDKKNDLGIQSPIDLIDHISHLDERLGLQMKEALDNFRPAIVLNQVRSMADVLIGYSMQNACKK